MNTGISMNSRSLSGMALEKALAAKLEALLRGVVWLRGWQVQHVARAADAEFDLLATLPLPGGGKAALCVECKRELRPSVFRMVADKTFSPAGRPKVVVPVLALPWVSPRVAELCAEHGWSWFDLAGNYRLDVPGLLQLQHAGNEPVHARPRPTANLRTPEAGRVLRALLLPDNAGMRWTQREMQKHCEPNVSLGLVNKVVRHLRDEAFIETGEDGGFRLRDPLKLLFAWRDAYRFDRHERRGYFTLSQGKKLRDALALLDLRTGGFAAYAAFSAADFQAPHVRQPKTWLYVREQDISLVEELVEAKRVDSGENLVVLIPDDDGVFYLGDGGTMGDNRMRCTNVVQTYVDLCHSGGRGGEAAEALLNQRLKPEWKLRGLNV
jgi:rhodanese-related sulfurtransferase